MRYARVRVFTDLSSPVFSCIYDSALIRENAGQRKPVFSLILCSERDNLDKISALLVHQVLLKFLMIKKRLIRRCFPVKFAKFLITPILNNICKLLHPSALMFKNV